MFPRANYGPNEDPRKCPDCGKSDSRVKWTEVEGRTKYRHRACKACGEQYTSAEEATNDDA